MSQQVNLTLLILFGGFRARSTRHRAVYLQYSASYQYVEQDRFTVNQYGNSVRRIQCIFVCRWSLSDFVKTIS